MADKLFGMYRAMVIGNKSKKKDGWIYVRLLNTAVINKPFWAAPAFGLGQFHVPAAFDTVFVFFEEGYVNSPVYFAQWYIDSKIPEEVIETYPSRRLFKTKKGHKIEFEETKQKEMIKITSAPKGENKIKHTITLDVENELIEIRHMSDKSLIQLDKEGKVHILSEDIDLKTKKVLWESDSVSWKAGDFFELQDKNGNKLSKTSNGVELKDKHGNKVNMTNRGVTITDKFNNVIEMVSGKININSRGQIILANGTKGVVRAGDKSFPHTHKVVTSTGSGTALPTTVKFVIVSNKVKAG